MVDASQSSQFFKAYYKSKPRGRSRFGFLLFLVLLIASGIGIVYWLGYPAQSDEVRDGAPVSTDIAISSVLPTSSVSAVLNVPATREADLDKINMDRGGIKIAVLNGSGAQGAATGTASYLKRLGYNVVKTDNADGFDYNGVEISVKKSFSRYALILKKDMEGFVNSESQGDPRASVSAGISDNITYDAQVIVGE